MTSHLIPTPPFALNRAASWRFAWLTLTALLIYRNSKKCLRLNPWTALVVLAGIALLIQSYGVALGLSLVPLAIAMFVVGLRFSVWSGRHPVFVTEAQDIAMVVKAGQDGSWKPDVHVKRWSATPAAASAFRVDVTSSLLMVANREGISLCANPRDAKLFRKYLSELNRAQDKLGIAIADRRKVVTTRNRFMRGCRCVAPPAPSHAR